MKILSNPRFLAIYSGILTTVFAVVVFCGAVALTNPTFGTVTARRINIIEPDGTVRLTISNRADFPGAWNRGKEYPRPDRTEAAGLLFMSEEGTEQGGLIWGASQQQDGTVENHVHLSFDQYEENQVFAIDAGQSGKDKFSEITMVDQGTYPIEEKRAANAAILKLPADKQDAAWNQFFAAHRSDVKRVNLGRSADGSVGLRLRDENGRVRMILAVQTDGQPVFQFLDQDGKITREMPAVNALNH